MFERFTNRANEVMVLSSQEAKRFNHEYIGTEHILLGVIKKGDGVGVTVLRNNFDVGDLSCIRGDLEKFLNVGPDMVTLGSLPYTPRAKKVVEYSIEFARGMNHNYVGTEHLVGGLIEEKEGLAAQVLMNRGVTMERYKAGLLSLLGVKQEDEQNERVVGEEYQVVVVPKGSLSVEQLINMYGFEISDKADDHGFREVFVREGEDRVVVGKNGGDKESVVIYDINDVGQIEMATKYLACLKNNNILRRGEPGNGVVALELRKRADRLNNLAGRLEG